MRKLLFIGVCCLCLCGCGKKNSWGDKLQISSLQLHDLGIFGEIKNVTEKAYNAKYHLN